jgi:hypothetical protein
MRSPASTTSIIAATGIPIPRPIFAAVSSPLLAGIAVIVGVGVADVEEAKRDEVVVEKLKVFDDVDSPGDAEERNRP